MKEHHIRYKKVSRLVLLALSVLILSGLGGCIKIPVGTVTTLANNRQTNTYDSWLSSSLQLQQKNGAIQATLNKIVTRQIKQTSKQISTTKERAIFAGLFPGLLSYTCGFDGPRNHEIFCYVVCPITLNMAWALPNIIWMIKEPSREYGPGAVASLTIIGFYKNTKTSTKTEIVPETSRYKRLLLPYPDATVTLTAPTLGKKISAKTDKEGIAVFNLLQIAPASQSVDIIVRAAKMDIPPDEVHMKVSIPETE